MWRRSRSVSSAPLKIEVHYAQAVPPAADGVLAAVRFDSSAAVPADSLTIDVRLAKLRGPAIELWRATGAVRRGRSGIVRHASDDHCLFGVAETDEREHGGIAAAAEFVYREIHGFQNRSGFPHFLRMWNYFDSINAGDGDDERYRQFVIGRARGLDGAAHAQYPAATAIGQQQTTHRLQVYWLAGRQPGEPIENPRQVSAYRYPRVHGPVSPGFARATLAADGTLLISGTASIVGHESRHPGDAREQLEEIVRNLAALPGRALRLLKVYVREPALLEMVAERLREGCPGSEVVFLAGDICRRELLVEIEAVGG
jgi:chorismate lyase/3-hydroxybenzoate synthase